MGQHEGLDKANNEEQRRRFMRALLDDVRALEHLLDSDLVERGVRRIGAEQEMFLVDAASRPSPCADALLESIADPAFTHELGLFNLEANLPPRVLGGDCLRRMEEDIAGAVARARHAAQALRKDVALVGILPTLHHSDLTLDNMVPLQRYRALNDELRRLRGSDFRFAINGTDRLEISHENFMLEACNTSFQVHFQVAPEEFAKLYNCAQAVAGPVLAAAGNSPVLFNRRLWHETRIAIFEYSIDSRSEAHQARGHLPRVHFGDHWIDQSVIEIFREDIARFRVLLTGDIDEDPMAKIRAGQAPPLNALCLHNGTVYRWNRACYGVVDGLAHLRIENRILPAGPTVLDQVANSAFYFGLLSALSHEVEDIRTQLEFSEARNNFFTAARDGLKAQQTWFGNRHMPAAELITSQLLPMAERGLEKVGIDHHDIERYMRVIEERTSSGRTGARWMLDSLQAMPEATADQRSRSLTAALVKLQQSDKPVSQWPLATLGEHEDWRESFRTVGQFMTTDLFTVRPDDLIDFAASLMEWRHIRHVPVEDDQGGLVGLVSHRSLLRVVARGGRKDEEVAVRDIMHADPVVVEPKTSTLEAIRIMRENGVGCLPVVRDGQLVGMLTQKDLIDVAARVLEQTLEELE
jgi:CBS domain-containing protein